MGKRSKDEDVETATDGGHETVVAVAGPLAPWRLVLVVALAAVTTGMPLMHAAQTGVGLDMALLRSFGIAFLAWVALGRINRVLGRAAADELQHPAARLSAVPDWKPDAPASPASSPAAPSPATSTSASTASDHEDHGRAA